MATAVDRFSGHADVYDSARPQPPAALADLLMQWSGAGRPDVTDVGSGTGLSAMMWLGRARSITTVEPGAQMRGAALRRLGLPVTDGGLGEGEAAGTRIAVTAGSAEATGQPDASADIVTASQAMHWFDASRALPEIVRVLRPGGVFAAVDCDWPPCIDWETDAAYAACDRRVTQLETERGLRPPHAGKRHLETLRESGLFRFVTEVALHSQEEGDASRVASLALSQGGTQALLADGASEDEIGLTALREVAARRLARPRPWWFTYRVRMGLV